MLENAALCRTEYTIQDMLINCGGFELPRVKAMETTLHGVRLLYYFPKCPRLPFFGAGSRVLLRQLPIAYNILYTKCHTVSLVRH